MSNPMQIVVPASPVDTTLVITTLNGPPAPIAKMKIGTNVPQNEPLAGYAAFGDVAKSLTGWYSVNGALTYDPNGYPIFAGLGSAGCWTYLFAYPSGSYKLSWHGQQNGISIQGKTIVPVADGSGGWTANVSFNTGDRVEFRSPGGITSLSLLSPDAKPGQTFRDAYLALLKPYSVIRLMDMQQTNGRNGVVRTDWATRTMPSSFDQTTNEVAAEYLAELCKESGCIPWLNIPYGAPDVYIQGLAQIFASFPVSYWEYSNELWNNGSSGYQGNQVRSDGQKLGFGTDPNQAGARYHASLTAHMASLIKPIIPGAKIVFGAQMAWNQWATDGLLSLVPGIVDFLAIAPYFQTVSGDPVGTVDQVIASCKKWISTTMASGISSNASVASKYGCGMIAYEGGQSLIPNPKNSPLDELVPLSEVSAAQWQAYLADPMRQAQLDSRMGSLYDTMFSTCLNAGMGLFVNEMVLSNWGKAGFWGVRQQTTDTDTPKSLAVVRAIAASV